MQWGEELRRLKTQNASGETLASNPSFFATLRDHLETHADRLSNCSEAHTMEKKWNLETQCALRCATLACADTSSRCTIQELGVVTYAWHLSLFRIISSPPGSDQKSRLLAARLLSNLVTGNPRTALTVMTSIARSPSADQVAASIKVMSKYEESSASAQIASIQSMNWTDAMLSCSRSGNRDALAAVVAALHNCVAVIDDDMRAIVASDQILISTMLRHILPASNIVQDSNQSAADDATEWISVFLDRLTGLGLLPTLFFSIGSSSVVTPEHLVLLHCISGRVDEWLQSATTSSTLHPLGDTNDCLIETHLFLARLASQLRKAADDNAAPAAETTSAAALVDNLDSDTSLLTKSALIVVLEILATSLGSDSNRDAMALVRSKLGTETEIIIEVALDLGLTVDALLQSSRGVKARELKLRDEDQRWITTLVRVLGNICFRCRSNQDALRYVNVPTMIVDDQAAKVPPPPHNEQHRTALHVLLSCTSLAYGCFTLREWAIVALRNVLEGNLENQELVEKLEAQQPLQSPELEKMGLQVDLDRQGKVKIVQQRRLQQLP